MNNPILFLIVLLSIPLTSLFAEEDFENTENWSFVCGIESGVVVTSNAGKSKTFPIDSPTDEFYEYSSHKKKQTKAIYGFFLGADWQGLVNWDVQFDVKYSQSSSFSVSGILTQGMDVQTQDSYNYKYKIAIKQLLLESKLSYINCTRFKPYVLVGVGSSFNKAYSFSTSVPSLLTFTRTYKNHTSSGFTYAIGTGLDIEITNCFYVGVNYRFTDLGRVSLGSASIDDIPVSGTLSQSNFYVNQLSVQLTFLF